MDLVKKAKIKRLTSEDNLLFKNTRLELDRISICQLGKSVTNAVECAFSTGLLSALS